jgi:hypothetical protein
VLMLPARGPRPKLKGETALSLRLMDDVQIPQVAQTFGPGWHFFGRPQNESLRESQYSDAQPRLAVRDVAAVDHTVNADFAQASFAKLVSRDAASLGTSPAMPVFVLKTGAVLAVGNYAYQDNRITYTLAGGGGGVISTEEVDWSTTTQVNARRGVRVTLHSGHVSPETPGM